MTRKLKEKSTFLKAVLLEHLFTVIEKFERLKRKIQSRRKFKTTVTTSNISSLINRKNYNRVGG